MWIRKLAGPPLGKDVDENKLAKFKRYIRVALPRQNDDFLENIQMGADTFKPIFFLGASLTMMVIALREDNLAP